MAALDFTYTTYIVAPPDKIWAALTDGEITRRYFFGRRVESDWKAGSQVLYLHDSGRVDIQGKVIAVDEPRLLSYSWRVMWIEEYRLLPEAIVTFQIDPLGELVRLTMTESHPTPIDEKYVEGARRGWPYVLSGLKTLLETGRQLPALNEV